MIKIYPVISVLDGVKRTIVNQLVLSVTVLVKQKFHKHFGVQC